MRAPFGRQPESRQLPRHCVRLPIDPQTAALIVYTSGTTGRPKGAELTHSNIVINSMVVRDMGRCTKDDVLLVVLPLFHSFGFTCQMMAGILSSATLVLQPRFDAASVAYAGRTS